ncbi:putative membrane-associated protein [Synechococcus sp. PCC 7502]|uniref:DedA family protein n=1 Tax=Synechococcus sp. PCC 7502 TaxID=1173263 RepID=UPI00029FA844|nr:DedA family protein [Synechococcus sp. PCC 7502]AFY73275.1 putative membrane-associated protein [Synechococcus sp. PCC 7502]
MTFDFLTLEHVKDLVQNYGYGVIFLGIMLENAGIPIPGETITLVGGFLAGSGELKYPFVLGAAVSGAIIGDSAGYWLGRWGGMNLVESVAKIFKIEAEEVVKAREKFTANSDRAVFFGRFIALLRIFAGPMAGLTGMPYRRFLFFNALGAISWGTIMTALAYFTGSFIPLDKLIDWVLRFGIFALIALIVWVCVVRLQKTLAQGMDLEK